MPGPGLVGDDVIDEEVHSRVDDCRSGGDEVPHDAKEGESSCSAVKEFVVGCRLRLMHVLDGFKEEID